MAWAASIRPRQSKMNYPGFGKAHTSAAVSQSSSHASATAFVLLMKGYRFPKKFVSNKVAVYIRLSQNLQSETVWRIRSGRRPRLACKKV